MSTRCNKPRWEVKINEKKQTSKPGQSEGLCSHHFIPQSWAHNWSQKKKKYWISYYYSLGELTSQVEDSIAEKKEVPGIKTLNNPYVSGTIKKEEAENEKNNKIGWPQIKI